VSRNVPPPTLDLIPQSAPFSPEQRAWLNGFFAGLFSPNAAGVTALTAEQGAALMPAASAPNEFGDNDDGEAPWHDQTLPMGERLKLAEDRPLRRRFMAAMAQQDCGQCGYNCEDYANAIFRKQEARLNLCVPGGKETARMLKKLNEEFDTPLPSPPPQGGREQAAPGVSREHPVEATFARRVRLNKPGSHKETWHVEFDLGGTGLAYAVGDCFGIYPSNDPALVNAVIRALGAAPDVPVGERSLRDMLLHRVSLSPAPDMLFQLFSYLTGGGRRQLAKALAAGEDPDGDAATLDVLAAIEKFPGVRPDPEPFVEALDPLQPRLYSISSSAKVEPSTLSLTVDAVRYEIGGRRRLGVASTFIAERLAPGDRVAVYVQPAHAFGLPADPAVPIIMIGPGTGIAPFRAFLHERMATHASGRNWLFFGHQRRDCDFFYEDELTALRAQGVLTRLSLAWSRDGDEKFYVQDRMRQVGRDLWAWLAEGAHVYVCGDGKRMAKDVERALVDIVAQHGVRTPEQAIAFLAELRKQGRYQQDVY
jgi:sulfite reductase (NADPH) flavoprotein alpha-component